MFYAQFIAGIVILADRNICFRKIRLPIYNNDSKSSAVFGLINHFKLAYDTGKLLS